MKKSLALLAASALVFVSAPKALSLGGAAKAAKSAATKTVDSASSTVGAMKDSTKAGVRAEVQQKTDAVLGTAPAADTAKVEAPVAPVAPVVAAPVAPKVDTVATKKTDSKAKKATTKKTEKKPVEKKSDAAAKTPAAKPAAKK